MRLVLLIGSFVLVGFGGAMVGFGAQEEAAEGPTVEVYKSPT